MGCTASSPESVIGGAILVDDITALNSYPENNQNSDVNSLKLENNLNNREETIQQEIITDFKNGDFRNMEKSSLSKDPLPDIVGTTDSNEVDELHSLECKKGFVAFEVSLDGTVEPTIDSTKHPLPKRLKHLQPLEGAPKLTAEELNEKLERAERKRLSALAKRKSNASRCSDKEEKHAPSTSRPDQTGDKTNENLKVQNDDTVKQSDNEVQPENEQLDSGEISSSSSSLKSEALDPRDDDDNDDSSSNQQIVDVLDLNNSNNNARDLCTPKSLNDTKIDARSALEHYYTQAFRGNRRYLNIVAEMEGE